MGESDCLRLPCPPIGAPPEKPVEPGDEVEDIPV